MTPSSGRTTRTSKETKDIRRPYVWFRSSVLKVSRTVTVVHTHRFLPIRLLWTIINLKRPSSQKRHGRTWRVQPRRVLSFQTSFSEPCHFLHNRGSDRGLGRARAVDVQTPTAPSVGVSAAPTSLRSRGSPAAHVRPGHGPQRCRVRFSRTLRRPPKTFNTVSGRGGPSR